MSVFLEFYWNWISHYRFWYNVVYVIFLKWYVETFLCIEQFGSILSDP